MVKEVNSSWFKGKGALLKCLAFLLVGLIVILVALFVNLVVNKEELTCQSEDCIKESAEKLLQINPSADLCEDFYDYVCGNSRKNHTITFPSPEEQLNAMIQAPLSNDDTQPFFMMKQFYKSCLNLPAIEVDREETLLSLLDRLGYWPVLKGAYWNGSSYDWIDFMIRCKNLGLKFEWFVEFSVVKEMYPDAHYLKIDIPSYLKPLSASLSHARKALFTEVAVFLGASERFAHYETAKTINFEDELGTLAEKHKKDRDWNAPTKKITIKEVQQLWPSISWLDLVNNITGNVMGEDDYIVFDILDYVRDLNRLILGTPKRIQVDFMMWRIVEDFWPYLSGRIRDMFERYHNENFDVEPKTERQNFCQKQARKQFPSVVESAFVKIHVTPQKRAAAMEIAARVRKQVLTAVGTSGIERESRRAAARKLISLGIVVAGPDELFQNNRLDEELGVYGVEAATMIPAALLQDVFYNPQQPNYLNYATLGRAIAREIFNYVAKDGDGYVWWATQSIENLMDCSRRRPGKFRSDESFNVRGIKRHLSEFVAIDAAFEAYRDWVSDYQKEPSLPGLTYTTNQLFWIHTNKFMCGNRRFARFTIVEPLMNSDIFARVFGCPEGSKMNPVKKCKVL